MATKVDLRLRALRKIGFISEGQSPTAYQSEVVDEVIDEEQAYLEAEGIAYWETSSIPDGVMRGYVDVIAGRAAPRLLDAERAGPYTGLVMLGMEALRRFTATRGTERQTTHRFF